MKKVGMVSLGCAKNRVDSEVILGTLKEAGYEIVSDPAEAEIIFVNTCGFIEPAKEESIEAIFEMAKYKEKGRLQKLFVTGCLAQRYIDDLYREMPEVDGFMGVADYTRLLEMMQEAEAGGRPRYVCDGERFFHAERVLTTPAYSAYVKISDGCDNRCSYCAIPLIRGPYHSRPFDSIVEECRELAARGVTEITLIAQDTSRYGNDFPEGKLLLPELLEAVSAIEGVHWVRALYCYPELIDDELLAVMKEEPKVCSYLDIPLQHINDKVLREMNRRGDGALIRGLYRKIRGLGGFALRTTLIAGFPGETEEEFQELLQFVQACPFDRLGVFAYSEEEGTPAAARQDQVPMRVRKAREGKIMRAQQKISRAFNESRIGSVCEVLVEGREENGLYYGRSQWEAPETDGKVYIKLAEGLQEGSFVRVRITDAQDYDITGVLE